MAGTFAGDVLADGQLPSSKGTLYTVPASTWAYVKSFNALNTNAATQTIIVYLNTTGTSRQLKRAVLAENEFVEFLTEGETWELETGDLIEAVTTTATAVDYTITGVVET